VDVLRTVFNNEVDVQNLTWRPNDWQDIHARVLDEAARSGLSLAVAAKHFRLEP
jgi:hypothetical protein